MKNKSYSKSDEENDREVIDWKNNNVMNDSDSEDNEEVEEKKKNKVKRNYRKRVKCEKRSITEEIVCKYKRTENINNVRVTCTFPDCGAVLLYSNLKYHWDLHSDKTFKCDHIGCDEGFNTRSKLRKHRNRHLGKFKCDFDTCNYIGDSYSKLKIHKLSHSDERPIKCEHCDKGFKDKYGLQNHLKMVHLDQCPDLPLLVCETDGCKYKTKSKDSFIRHKHIHSLPLECNVCHKRFARKRLLDDHQYRHTGDKPFKCQHCSKSFPTEHLLNNHTMNLHRPKTIPCDVKGCEKKFTTTKNLNNHMKTHQDKSGIEKKFHCQWPDCHKKFQYRANLEPPYE